MKERDIRGGEKRKREREREEERKRKQSWKGKGRMETQEAHGRQGRERSSIREPRVGRAGARL